MPTDVLVVGAGPAGSVAALILARAGVHVRLVDRARFPRHKLCGDTVNPGSLALLDELGSGSRIRAAALPIRGMTVTGPRNARVAAEYPGGIAGGSLMRREFDQILVEAAIAAGAAFDDGMTVHGPQLNDSGRVTGVTMRKTGLDHHLPSRIVIAADGRGSRLGSTLGLTCFSARPRRWAFGAYYEGVEALTDRGEMHVRSDGYIGVAPMPGGIANVCVVGEFSKERRPSLVRVARADLVGSAPAQLQERVIERVVTTDSHLRERFVRATRVSDITVLGPLAVEARAAGCPGLLLAGDAAGFLDPMTGDGLRFALRGGMLAAEHALRELETGRPRHRELHAARAREFSRKWLINRALRTLVASPRGVAVAARIAACWNGPVRSLVAIAGDVHLARARDAA